MFRPVPFHSVRILLCAANQIGRYLGNRVGYLGNGPLSLNPKTIKTIHNPKCEPLAMYMFNHNVLPSNVTSDAVA